MFVLNIGLAVFNLLPIPPLDGGHIWPAILPRALHPVYYNFLPYGMILLIVLVMWPGANSGLSMLVRSAAVFIFGLLP
ncbi:Peptidase family M50 [compost metagenome]